MRLTVALSFVILLSAHASFSQSYYAECISIPSFYPISKSIQKNASGELTVNSTNKILKRDRFGDPLWEAKVTGIIEDVWLEDNGNVYALGYNYTPASYQLYKFNNDGTPAWGPKNLVHDPNSMSVDSQGNVYLSGYSEGTLFNTFDLHVTKYSPAGTLLWQNIFAFNIEGYTSTDIVANGNGESFIAISLAGNSLQTFLKLDSNGNLLWSETVNIYVREARAVYLDNDGNLLGLLSGFNSSSSSYETYIYKINKDGGFTDVEIIPIGDPTIYLKGANLYLMGISSSFFLHVFHLSYTDLSVITDFPLGEETFTAGSIRADDAGFIYTSGETFDSSTGKQYGFVEKYNSNGQLVWSYAPITLGKRLELDNDNNILAPFNGCLVKIYQCDNTLPTLTSEPTNKEVCAGTDVTFQVGARGKKLIYHWQKGTELLENSSKFAGTNTATLTVKGATAADIGTYSCTIVDGCGGTLNSRQATLSIIVTPALTVQPKDVSECTGGTAIFQITTAGGQNITYQWKKGNQPLIANSNITGTQTNKLTITALNPSDAGDYTCEVSAGCLAVPVVSQKAVLSVKAPTAISKNPESVATCSGKTITLTVTAGGTDLTYQWKKGATNLVESTRITGTKASTLTITTLQTTDAGEYTCHVTGLCGSAITSQMSVVTVSNDREITTQPQNKSVCAGTNTSFTINAAGTGNTYQWYKGNTVVSDNAKYTGSTTTTLGLTAVSSSEQGAYTCVVITSCGTKLTSTAAQLSIGTAGAIISKSADLDLCSGEPAKFSIATSGGVASYQWKKNNTLLQDDSSIGGSNTPELLLRAAASGDVGNYLCEITPICGAMQTSGIVKLSIKQQVEITVQPMARQVCEFEDFELKVTATGAIASYQWKKDGKDVLNGVNVTGAKTDKLLFLNSTAANEGYYTCEVTGCGSTSISNGVLVGVNPVPNLQLLSAIDCSGFDLEWSSLVIDSRNTSGTYLLYLDGSTEALGLNEIKNHGRYFIIKKTNVCADTVVWNNECIITGTEEISSLEITISPNPTAGWVYFRYPPGTERKFNIYNSKGMMIHSGNLNPEGETAVDANLWAAGIYTPLFYDINGKSITKRFILQR